MDKPVGYTPVSVRVKVGKRKTLKVTSYIRDDLVKCEAYVNEVIVDTLHEALADVEDRIDD